MTFRPFSIWAVCTAPIRIFCAPGCRSATAVSPAIPERTRSDGEAIRRRTAGVGAAHRCKTALRFI